MSEAIREQVSALLDGELSDGELGLLARRLERDEGLRAAFGRYVLIGETLRAPGGTLASPGFAARLAAAIDDTQVPAAAAPDAVAAHRRWAWPAALVASAAGAALAVNLLLQDGVRDQPAAAVAALPQRDVAGAPDVLVATATLDRERMTRYLVTHAQYAAPMARRIVMTNLLADDPGQPLRMPEMPSSVSPAPASAAP